MKKLFIGAAIISVLLTGDVRSKTESVQGPDGRVIHETSCQFSQKECYQEARATCKGNYQVIGSRSTSGGLLADAIPGPINWYYMTYACGQSNGAVASFPHQGGYYQAPRGVYVQCSGGYYARSCGGFY